MCFKPKHEEDSAKLREPKANSKQRILFRIL